MAQARRVVFHVGWLLIIVFVSLLAPRVNASTGHPENRPPNNANETNTRNRCANEGWQALRYGSIWLTASGSYYAGEVDVSASQNSVTVYIRGSVFGCHNTGIGNTYALNVTPTGANGWRLTNLSSTSLYRGSSQGWHNWSTQGGQISAQLDVSGLATNNQSGTATQTIYIDLYRCFSTNANFPTGTCYAETVPIVVRRAQQPAPTISCGNLAILGVSGNPEPGQPFILRPSFNVTSGTYNNSASDIEITSSGGITVPPPLARDYTPANITAPSTGTADFPNAVHNSPGIYTITWRLTGTSVSNCQGTVSIVSKPYITAYAGDVKACGAATAGNIKAFNQGAGGGYAGAGGQLGVFSRDSVTEFVSATLGATSSKPQGLTFANTNTSLTYGGEFGATDCIENYWDPAAPLGALPASPILARQIVYIDGSITIGNNIEYQLGSWTLGSTPYLRLVVNGDIYIAPSVARLEGDYIATGSIYTCANGGVPDSVYVRNNCQNQLTVFGNFIAPKVRLLRMFGTVREALPGEDRTNTKAAEVFIQSPENWFGDPGGGSENTLRFDSITARPPLL